MFENNENNDFNEYTPVSHYCNEEPDITTTVKASGEEKKDRRTGFVILITVMCILLSGTSMGKERIPELSPAKNFPDKDYPREETNIEAYSIISPGFCSADRLQSVPACRNRNRTTNHCPGNHPIHCFTADPGIQCP